MKIAQLAPIIESVPPKKYGGTERVVWNLTEELVKRGHEVTLFASGDSQTSAQLVSVYPKALREAKLKDIYGANVFTMLNIGLTYSRQDEFDIIHDHVGHLSLPTTNIATTPTVMTLHGAFNPENRRIFEALKNVPLVSISHAQAESAPHLNYIGNVYNGLKMDHYPFSDENEGYLLFVGRISMEKGTHLAIEVAQNLNLPLIMAAKLESVDMQYFQEYVGPQLSEQIRWVGEVNEKERNKLMSKALCLLHPITWKEPFGLTMIEAMTCGCPVVAINKGSVPEVVADGKTGFVVDDVEGIIEAVEKIHQIDRQVCRQHALKNFSAQRMADGYEEVYRKLLHMRRVKLPHNNGLSHLTSSVYTSSHS
ncbi:MAG: glycosyltransferase family 4 protein [bacterium]|nr:glycosyltransferase family 4 protein [bacterium]